MKTATDSTQEIATIVAGLLASGHFTEVDPTGDPVVLSFDTGKDWGSTGEYRRFRRHVVDEAFSLWSDIQKEAEIQDATA